MQGHPTNFVVPTVPDAHLETTLSPSNTPNGLGYQ